MDHDHVWHFVGVKPENSFLDFAVAFDGCEHEQLHLCFFQCLAIEPEVGVNGLQADGGR